MSQDTSSFKKVAVLTGLTMLVGGAEIASADTVSAGTQFFGLNGSNPPTSLSKDLSFPLFNPSLGNLTQVTIGLTSTIFENEGVQFNAAASSSLSGALVDSPKSGNDAPAGVSFTSTTHPALAGYTGPGSPFTVALVYSVSCGGLGQQNCNEGWTGSVSVSYDFTPTPSQVPLPAALPLFATGLAGLGVLGWARRLRPKAKKHA